MAYEARYGQTEAAAYATSRHGPDGRAFLDPYISAFLEQATGQMLLDVGGGAAKVGVEAVRRGIPFVYSLDNSPAMLEQAEMTIWDAGLPDQIATVLGDVKFLPYPDNFFPRLTSINVGCNLDNSTLENHFKEMARVVTNIGDILFTAPINLGNVFTSTNYRWPEDLSNALQSVNAIAETHELSQEDIQKALKDLNDIHRATFAVRGGQLLLVIDDINSLPTNLRSLAIEAGDIREGEAIWRKLPGLVVPNNWHTQGYYESLMQEAGLEWTMVSDNFATNAERYENNNRLTNTEEELSQQLGSEYVVHSPFAIYTLKRRSLSSTNEAEPINPFSERLQTITDTYNAFYQKHAKEISHLEKLSLEKAAMLGNQLTLEVAKGLGIGEGEKLRMINPKFLHSQLVDLSHGGVMLKRHGAQDHPNGNKIEMMQNFANANDHAKLISLAEAAGDAFALLYTSRLTNQAIDLDTSPDARALEVAQVFEVITNTQAYSNMWLKCLRFPDNPSPNLQAMLNKYKGTIPWSREVINAIAQEIPGEETFDQRRENIRIMVHNAKLLSEENKSLKQPGRIRVFICHSQEIQEIAQDPNKRLSELGTVTMQSDRDRGIPIVMDDGIFYNAIALSEFKNIVTSYNSRFNLGKTFRRLLKA